MRARNIKPGLFANEILGVQDPIYTLTFEGLWCLAQRNGVLEDRPLRIRGELFPYHPGLDLEPILAKLAGWGFITRYEADGFGRLIYIEKFLKHQSPHVTEKKATLPTPDGPSRSADNGGFTLGSTLDNGGNTPDSLIPDSLIPDSLIPDSPTQAEGVVGQDTAAQVKQQTAASAAKATAAAAAATDTPGADSVQLSDPNLKLGRNSRSNPAKSSNTTPGPLSTLEVFQQLNAVPTPRGRVNKERDLASIAELLKTIPGEVLVQRWAARTTEWQANATPGEDPLPKHMPTFQTWLGKGDHLNPCPAESTRKTKTAPTPLTPEQLALVAELRS